MRRQLTGRGARRDNSPSRRRLAGAVLTAGVAVSGTVIATPAHADVINCSTGYVCIIDPDPAPIGTVDYSWYYYGTYNIHNEHGYKDVCNQQYGWAVVRLYSGYDGTGTVLHTIRPADSGGHAASCPRIYITPVNSVRLSKS